MRRGWFYVLPMLAFGFVLLECKQPAPLRPQFVYVANFYSNLVSAYSIGSDGALAPVPGSSFGEDAAVGPNSIAVDSAAKFAFVANFASNNISAFVIGSNGTLISVPGSPFPGLCYNLGTDREQRKLSLCESFGIRGLLGICRSCSSE